MGALTNNRKRPDDYSKSLLSISSPVEPSSGHNLKRPKISVPAEQCTPDGGQPAPLRSVTSIIARYPDKKAGLSREVHAPVRSSRYRRFSSGKNGEIASSTKESSSTGKIIFRVYEKARDLALGSLRFFGVSKEESAIEKQQKRKDVIEIDSGEEKANDTSDDSSIEELELPAGQGVVGKEVRSLDSSLVTDGSNVNSKLDEAEKMELVLMDQVLDDSEMPPYRRLLEGVKNRDDKLSSIKFEIELVEKSLKGLEIVRPPKKEEGIKKDVAKECFVPLTEEEKAEVSDALSNFNRKRILVTHENSNIDITGQILQCLRPGAWLNDEVINVYVELLKEREKRNEKKFLKCHFFNTFFYKKLISGRGGYNFQSVRRWTTHRKLGYALIDCDKIFVPIHKEVHWCLAIINKKDKKFQYLDSLKGDDNQVMNVLAKYFVDEVKDKCGKDIDVSSWDRELVVDLPEQENGFDCGMFMIKYADFYSRDIGLCFRQEHMPYFRQRTAKEILRLKAD